MAFRKLGQIAVPGCSVQISYSSRIAPTFAEIDILNSANHPLRPMYMEKLVTMPADILHWKVVTDPSKKVLPKQVLRSDIHRRWSSAFRQALLQNGYATNGQSLKTSPPERGLAGRLELLVTRGQGFHSSKEMLLDQCCKVVAALEQRQRAVA